MTEHGDQAAPPRRARLVALGLAVGYAALGGLYIGLSDRVVAGLGLSPAELTAVQTYKGVAYVGVTALLLYFLVFHFLAALERSNRSLAERRDRLLELNRVQALVRAVNATLLRVNDEELLLRAACRAIVREGGFPYAWIGLVDAESGRLERVATAGGDSEPPGAASIPLSDDDSVVTQPLGDGQPHGLRGHGDAWLDRAIPPGIPHEAALVLPLRTAEGISGVITIYGRASDRLEDPEERRLLAEVADNVALGIGYLRQRRTVQHLTYHDELTGIGNRHLIENRLVAALTGAEQRHGAVGVMVLDVDRFRETNDTGGRSVGDRVLQATARILSGVIRPGDTVGRLGNDEFALVFTDLPSVDLVSRLAGRVADRFPQRIDADGLDVYLSVSMGVAVYPGDGASARELLARAEIALHSQPDDQLSTLTYYAPEFDRRARERRDLELALRGALEAGEFRLEWQPVTEIGTRRTVGSEALLRWDSARLGAVAPDRFIPLAEQTGLVVAIGAWVVDTACAQAAAWRGPGGRSMPPSTSPCSSSRTRASWPTCGARSHGTPRMAGDWCSRSRRASSWPTRSRSSPPAAPSRTWAAPSTWTTSARAIPRSTT